MVAVAAKIFLVKAFLPCFLLTGAILRPSFISLGYVILALFCTYLPTIKNNAPFPILIRLYTLLCLVVSLITSVGQFAYQLYQHLLYPENDEYIELCNTSSTDFWLRQIGFIRVPGATHDPIALRLFIPELFALFGSLITFITCAVYPTDLPPFDPIERTPLEQSEEQNLETELTHGQENQLVSNQTNEEEKVTETIISASKRASDTCIVFAVCLVGIIMPSILNAPYFIFMLVIMTWWALYTPLTRSTFNTLKRAFIMYLALHFIALYAYQMDWFQEILPANSLFARLLGFYALISPNNCERWYDFTLNKSEWIPFLNFAAILFLHYLLDAQYRWTFSGVKSRISKRAVQSTVVSDSSQQGLLSSPAADQQEFTDTIPLQRITSEVMDRQKISQLIKSRRESEPGFILVRASQEFLYFSLYHCYVFALLSMMMWALLYHSVFGLLFLLLTCFLWALVNSRKWTFTLSPFLLAYVEFLLLTQYVFSMNLHKNELHLSELLEIIGFRLEQSKMDAFLALFFKIILSIPIFVLLRLHLRENYYNSLGEEASHLRHINYGTFNQIHSEPAMHRKKHFPHGNEDPFAFVSQLLTKYWIFLVTFCILLNSPITGDKDHVSLFSIGFFTFFVVLVLLLVASFRLFRKVIFGFFTILIIYSSVVLVSIYCYQFKGVPKFWANWTHLTPSQSKDIGLIDYEANEFGKLFGHLTKLIALVIVTMLQLKFFHNPWSKLVDQPIGIVQSDVETTDGIERAAGS